MPLTQYARGQALQYAFTAAALTRPTAWYLSLHAGFPGDSGTAIANEFTSGAAAGYGRVSATLAFASNIISNTNAPSMTAGGTWPAATYLGIGDAASAGNLWAYSELSQGGATFFLAAAQFANPGSGYAANDTITLTGGGGAVLTVDSVATVNGVAGVPVTWHASAHGSVSAIPAAPLATTTSGAGTGATVLASWLQAPQSFQLNNTDSITWAAGAINLTVG
ncbi:MAG: hypothetical protein HIU82_02070 [Proteobacteria bacterium]|nr:hypothetical protein [Pseudomonadota bacterium]